MQDLQMERARTNAHTGSCVSHTSITTTPNINIVTENYIGAHFASRIDGTNGI